MAKNSMIQKKRPNYLNIEQKSINIEYVDQNLLKDFYNLILTGNVSDIDIFINKNNININLIDSDNNSILHKIISSELTKFQKLSLFKYFLYTKKVNINSTNKYGDTPLLLASKNFDVHLIKELISNKANLNSKDYKGATPLHYIAKGLFKDVKSYEAKSIIDKPSIKHDKKIISEFYKLTYELYSQLNKKFCDDLNLIGNTSSGQQSSGQQSSLEFKKRIDYFINNISKLIKNFFESSGDFNDKKLKSQKDITDLIKKNLGKSKKDLKLEIRQKQNDLKNDGIKILKKYDTLFDEQIDLEVTDADIIKDQGLYIYESSYEYTLKNDKTLNQTITDNITTNNMMYEVFRISNSSQEYNNDDKK